MECLFSGNVDLFDQPDLTELVQELVVDIFKLCIEFNIQLFSEWIQRSDNQWADVVSKDLDRDDYMLHFCCT